MKLEYIHDLTAGGKYKDVVSENLVRLYHFDKIQTEKLTTLISKYIIGKKEKLNLSDIEFIESVNCQLTLQLSDTDIGILRTQKNDIFNCYLTKDTYLTAIEIMKTIDSGYNWLCDISKDDIDFLYSSGGTW